MLLISLYILISYVTNVECCDIAALSGNVLGCVHNDTEVHKEQTQNGAVATDTICIVENQQGVVHVYCNDTLWEIQEVNNNQQRQIRRKRGWRRFFRSAGDIVRAGICVASLFTSCVFGSRTPSDKTPPSINCLQAEVYVTAKPFLYVAKATWEKPTAFDQIDGSIIPKRLSGYPRGQNFPEGKTKVTYEAKDRSGNRASCDIFVIVKVVRCDPPIPMYNGFYQCNPVTEYLNGGTCKFGCYEGFDLRGGPDHVYCKDNGQWSNSQPSCHPWKCPDLPRLEKAGKPKCTNASYFRSICSYNCEPGFDMPPKVSKSLVCDKTKSWRMHGSPKCVDIEPPKFKPGTCGSTVIAGTETGLNSTKVSWTLPDVTDNSNNAEIYSTTKYSPGDRLETGIYSVEYKARDAAGNIALNKCSFKLIVREIRCSKLYPTPYLHIDCPDGYRSGAKCNISCDPGKILVGSDNVMCNRKLTQLYGVWNWKENMQSRCINGRTCYAIPPPENGAIVCDNWEGGQFCQVQCKNGTQMSSVSLNKLYVCQSQKGEWSTEPPKMKTCRAIRSYQRYLYIGIDVHYYFDGDCSDPQTRLQIASNFIEVMKASLFQAEACPDSIECNKENVHISCGKSSRRKRDVNSTDILILTVNLPLSFNGNGSLYTEEDRYNQLLGGVHDVLSNNIESIFGNRNVSQKNFVNNGLQVVCPQGSVQSKQSLDCIDCPEGTFYTNGSDSPLCKVCRKGTFQDKAAQFSCEHCEPGKTTRTVGATKKNDCEEACLPGTFSKDGLLPCSPCEQGYFQISYGQTLCQPCQGSKTTLTFGSSSASDCEEFDIQLIEELQSEIQMTSQNSISIKDFTLGFWYQNTATVLDKFPTIMFSVNRDEIQWMWEGLRLVKQKGSIGSTIQLDIPDTRWHYIVLYNDDNCSVSVTIDDIALPDADAIGSCTDISFNSISVTAENGTKGSFSQINIWRGNNHLRNRRKCFEGDIGNVFSWKNMEEAEISGAFIDIPSQCDDIDNCVSSPCIHGSCSDVLHGFTCRCEQGYFGTRCEKNIDDCESNICMNNATCLDGIADYSCSCPSNFTGQYCEIQMVDGIWSDWSSWSECSTTCGYGERNRKRLCNSPSPDNGGKICQGDAFDIINCNNRECPVCPEIPAPVNGYLNCENDTETFNCTVSCDAGFEFDIEPLPLYYCGQNTFQEWNYQTDENPERRLPRCVGIKVPLEMTIIYSAHYEGLYCANQDLEDFAIQQIDFRVNTVLSNVACLVKDTCSLNYVQVIDCDSKIKGRRRRFMGRTAGFSLELQINPTIENTNETMQDLEDAFKFIQNAADSGDLTVRVLDDDYELESNSSEVKGDVKCASGQTKVMFYCVPCGPGSYSSKDICKPCPVGSYQDIEGQSSCVTCPKGKSTIGIRSTTVHECTVNVLIPVDEGLKVTAVIVGCLCGLVIVTMAICIYMRYSSKKTFVIEPVDIDMMARSGSHLSTGNGKLGPKHKRFEQTSLSCQSDLPQMSHDDHENEKDSAETEN